jgi:S-adenosylmethionine:tRNA ribosyltransferase-isomerase
MLTPPLKPDIRIAEYDYRLPDERIPRFPLEARDRSKLLTYAGGRIETHVFEELPALLPNGALLVFNETKVIPARLHFRKESGGVVELFCLTPVAPADYERSMAATGTCEWRCMAGRSKRWKGTTLRCPLGAADSLSATLVERERDSVTIRFSWEAPLSFSEVLEACGAMPIPPYLHRTATADDRERYQTVYARCRGSVAAPTAGLHFTQRTLADLAARGLATATLTLHVGAGTFRPVQSETIAGHVMHSEPFSVTRATLQTLLQHRGTIVAVGTTSARTLESLYFLGLQALRRLTPQAVAQWEPYETPLHAPVEEALQALLQYMDEHGMETLHASTQLLIAPPYPFRLVRGLITNFHQPKSTLLLLVAALIGNDWRKVYDYALEHHFRFLSYGDGCFLS